MVWCEITNCCKPDCRAEVIVCAAGQGLLLTHYQFKCPKCGSKCFTNFSHGTELEMPPKDAIHIGKDKPM